MNENFRIWLYAWKQNIFFIKNIKFIFEILNFT